MSLKWHVTKGEILGFFYIILQVVLALIWMATPSIPK